MPTISAQVQREPSTLWMTIERPTTYARYVCSTYVESEARAEVCDRGEPKHTRLLTLCLTRSVLDLIIYQLSADVAEAGGWPPSEASEAAL